MKGSLSAPKPDPFAGGPAILNCPAHSPFLKTLAASILNGSIWNAGAPEPHDLPGLTIYLPSQAAVQPLKLEFLWLSPNEATFLPRIRVLGDADPLDLFANYGTRMESTKAAIALLKKALAIPSAFTELERQIHLSACALEAAAKMRSTITAPGERLFPDVPAVSAAAIASEIGALIDEAHNEGADLSRIDRLDNSEASGSEQLSLQLLRAVRKGWAAYKLRINKLDGQERRNRLMAVEAEFIRESNAPVIIAGSTASVAATMALMETLKERPNSAIVLHGLDRHLDAESWAVLGGHPEHPQHGLHQLLSRLDAGRETIRDLAPPSPGREGLRRATFLSEALRPASTTAQWASFASDERKREGSPVPGLALIEAETTQDEAAAIALILREALETKGQTAALVTPDENLIARVRHALTHWGLANPAEDSNPDAFALRIAATAASGKPEDLVALLRTSHGDDAAPIRRCAELIDLGVLRQMWRPSSMAEIPAALARAQHAIAAGEARHAAMKRIEAAEWEGARTFSERVLDALSPITSKAGDRLSLREWTAAHSAAASQLAELGFAALLPEEDEPSTLVEAARVAAPALKLDLGGYAGFFGEISRARQTAKENQHPRLFLRRPLDARLLAVDVLVLGGLNEGSWPQISGPSPWLNRRDRAFVGLSPEERRIGLAAQDFAALAAVGSKVFLTRAKKVNGGLARPSRWIARLKALARGAGKLETLQPEHAWLSWARLHREPIEITPVESPAPLPPLAARPRRLSVTAIETWFANPYAIYARHILGLEPLRRIGETHDARDKGILYHAALHRFFQIHPGALPPNAADDLVRCLDKAAGELGFNLENAPFWRPRFARFAHWFTSTEDGRRASILALKSEVGGKLKLDAAAGPFEVTARADRIDIGQDGAVCIYDFKTSANAAETYARHGAQQLALEGFLVREGAFAGIPPGSEPELRYIVATGGEPPGKVVEPKAPCAEVIQAAATALPLRIARFDDPATPYAYERHAIFRARADHDPYAHLARVKEWSTGGNEEEADDD
ncbi:MAG: double-strand break repair protein AddB [Rhodomicrobium sp.]